jgi:hypothetical protein
MFLQMKLRFYDCLDCGTPCKSTSPNAVRCPKCAKAWGMERNRRNQRRRYRRIRVAGRASCPVSCPSHAARRLAMRIGKRSVLYGAHCVLLHPWFVALAWWRLNGFPWDVRLWFAFWLHDAGYIGKPNLDGPEGETHVELGARIMGLFFGKSWGAFTAAHSRYWAKRNGCQVSRLCLADKLAFVLTPAWLYLPMARATGELYEYMLRARERQAGSVHFTEEESRQLMSADAREWLAGLKSYTRRWIDEHRNGCEDTWTVNTTHQDQQRQFQVGRAGSA